MKKVRRAHLWIGLITSIFIFIEAATGLLMNEPWIIGQSQLDGGRGNFQPGQFSQFQNRQGGFAQGNGQDNGQAQGGVNGGDNGQVQGQGGINGTTGNGQFQGRNRFNSNGNFFPGMMRGDSQGILGTIRNLHEGRIGNMNVKWFLDLVAIAMMALTGTGIYLSIKVLGAERNRNKRKGDNIDITN